MNKVEIYTTPYCPFCARAKADLDSKDVRFQEIDVFADAAKKAEMMARSGRRTVPQIFIDGHHVGGSDDLRAAEASGELDRLLAGESPVAV